MDPSGTTAISIILGTVIGMVFGALGFFLDIIIDNLTLLSNSTELRKKISTVLSKTRGKVELMIEVLLGGIDGALSSTNKYKVFKAIYNVISTIYHGIKDGIDVLGIVIDCIISYICSKLFHTEQTFSKFNSKKIKNKGKALSKKFKDLSMNDIKEFSKVIKNQIIYYVKSNKKVYKRFIGNYALSTVTSWTSKLPELAKAIKSMA